MYYSNYNQSPEEQQPIEAPSFHVHNDSPKAKKNHLGAKITAACLACALVGGLAGGGVMLATGGQGSAGDTADAGSATTLYQVDRENTAVNVSNVAGGEAMTISEIYAANVNSTVGITTELVTTNFWGQPVASAAAGSGFVISADGYIVTNYHVIEGANSIQVTFYDGTTYDATLVGGEEDSDIAVLKIDATGLTPVTLGDSDALTVGEQVVAIGNPLGELTFTLTSGYVSALNRPITMSSGTVMNMIQTDTAINSGNSGGPLFNIYGEVVGITSAKLSNSTNSSEATIEGLGFAIPISDVKSMITDIIENGYVTGKAYMGITPAEVSDEAVERYGISDGVYVDGVTQGSAADKAGLQEGDIITALGDTPITSYSDLKLALRSYRAGDSVSVTVDRNGQTVTLNITFDEVPSDNDTAQPQSQQQQQQSQGGNYWPFGGMTPFQ